MADITWELARDASGDNCPPVSPCLPPLCCLRRHWGSCSQRGCQRCLPHQHTYLRRVASAHCVSDLQQRAHCSGGAPVRCLRCLDRMSRGALFKLSGTYVALRLQMNFLGLLCQVHERKSLKEWLNTTLPSVTSSWTFRYLCHDSCKQVVYYHIWYAIHKQNIRSKG